MGIIGIMQKKIFTPEEIPESNLHITLIGVLIKARQKQELSQKKLEQIRGVKQPIIIRMEKGTTSPQFDIVFKVLISLLGKTLTIVC